MSEEAAFEPTRSSPAMPNAVERTRREMMATLGINDIEQLYSAIPSELRLRGPMGLPRPLGSEMELKLHVESILEKNSSCAERLSFLGGGCARHYVPAICDEINGRSEFLTAYCGGGYSDHGKLQAVFEYTSMMGELLDMDVVSYTTFDGGQAAASALRMAGRITGRQKVILPITMNPEIASQIRDYGQPALEPLFAPCDAKSGRIDLAELERLVTEKTAAVFIENPSYLGFLEEGVRDIAAIARKKGALFIVYADPSSLGILEAPANYGADISCGEIQGLGMHQQYGGGLAGYIATRDEERFIKEIPTYLYGIMGPNAEGQYGWGRALNYRTSHGSREKAREYFGTGCGLWAITAGLYLALMGPCGMRELGENIARTTAYAMRKLASVPGLRSPRFAGAHFKEFAVDFGGVGMSVAEVNSRLLERGIYGGKDLSRDFPRWGQCALYCVTEMTRKADIDRLDAALREILA